MKPMITMKKEILIALVLLVTSFSFAQNGVVKQAHKMYDNMAYAKAIDLYEYAVEKNVKDPMILRNLADSYEKIRAFEEASKYYAQLVQMEGSVPSDYLNYAQNLKTVGNYSESKTWMSKFASAVGSDSRAIKHNAAGNYEVDLKKNADRYNITALNINTPGMDWGPSVYGNKLVFASNRSVLPTTRRKHSWNNRSFLDLYEGQLTTEGNVQNPQLVNGKLNTKYHEGGSCFSPNGETIWFTRNNYYEKKVGKTTEQVINLKIYSVSKDVNGQWSNELKFPHNSNEYSVGHPTLTKDGKTMYFTSDMPGGMGGKDIWKCSLDDSSEWSVPVNCGDVNTEGDEMFPFIAEDGTLYFASNGHVGLGGLDVFAATGSGTNWSVENMGYPLNDAWDDFALVLRNETEGYFSSNRPGGQGSDDIYKFIMDPKPRLAITGVIKNEENKNPLKGAKAILVDANGNVLEETVVGDDGKFDFDLDPELCNYKIKVNNGEGWSTAQTNNTPCNPSDPLIDEGDIYLAEMKFGAIGTIKDKATSAPIQDFKVILMDNKGNEIDAKMTSGMGKVDFPLEGDTDYKIRFEKQGYLAKNGQFTTMGMEPGIIEINKFVDLNFETVEVGKVFEIENIFFDLNKDNIRPDAAVELDKIVKIMNENPTIVIELGSHTDSRGSDKYNADLSDRRAKSSAAYIVSRGIASNRISGRGYGEAQLKNRCKNGVKCSDAEHQANRRTEFKIVKF